MIMHSFQMTGTYIHKTLITCINPTNYDVRRDLVPKYLPRLMYSLLTSSVNNLDGPFRRPKHVVVSYILLLSEVVVLIDYIYILYALCYCSNTTGMIHLKTQYCLLWYHWQEQMHQSKRVEPAYNDSCLCDTSPITSDTLCYQLIPCCYPYHNSLPLKQHCL